MQQEKLDQIEKRMYALTDHEISYFLRKLQSCSSRKKENNIKAILNYIKTSNFEYKLVDGILNRLNVEYAEANKEGADQQLIFNYLIEMCSFQMIRLIESIEYIILKNKEFLENNKVYEENRKVYEKNKKVYEENIYFDRLKECLDIFKKYTKSLEKLVENTRNELKNYDNGLSKLTKIEIYINLLSESLSYEKIFLNEKINYYEKIIIQDRLY